MPIANNSLPRVFTILGRRGHVIHQAFHAVGLKCSYQRRYRGPRRIFDVLYEILAQFVTKSAAFDAVLVDSVEYLPLAWIIARLYRKPLVIRMRGDARAEVNQAGQHKSCGGSTAKIILLFYGRILRRCQLVAPVSRYLSLQIQKHETVKEENIRVLPISVDVNDFSLSKRQAALKHFGLLGKKVILSVTNFRFPDKIRELERIFPALKILFSEYADLVFLIAGKGPYLNNFKKKTAASLGRFATRVKFMGYVQEVEKLYAASTFVVYFSGLDAFPRAILEAQASARPVIANPFGGIPEMIEHGKTGYLINTEEKFLQIARNLLNSRDLREAIGSQARLSVGKHFSPVIIGKKWIQILNEIKKKFYVNS